MELSTLTFFSWAVMSAVGWTFLELEVVALVEGSAETGSGDWPTSGGWLDGAGWPAGGGWLDGGVGSGGLGLVVGSTGL